MELVYTFYDHTFKRTNQISPLRGQKTFYLKLNLDSVQNNSNACKNISNIIKEWDWVYWILTSQLTLGQISNVQFSLSDPKVLFMDTSCDVFIATTTC